MADATAQIALGQEIAVILTAVDTKTGQPIPGAVISNVKWNQDNPIGTLVADPKNPNQAVFTPSKPGVVHFSGTAVVTIP